MEPTVPVPTTIVEAPSEIVSPEPTASDTSTALTEEIVAASSPNEGNYEEIPGTSISLLIPDGFVLADLFPGIIREEELTSIVVTEMPSSVTEVKSALTSEQMATRGMTLIQSDEVQVDGTDATFLHVSQVLEGTTFRKWMVVFGDETSTLMLVATTPQALEAKHGDALQNSLLTARWDPDRVADFFEGLDFTIEESEELEITDRVSNMLLLTKPGAVGPVPPSDPLFVVGSSHSEVPIADIEAFARQRVVLTDEIEEIENISGNAIKVDGLPAYEIVADARDLETGTPLMVYQTVVLEGERYYIMQGLVGTEQADKYLPVFREIVESFRQSD